jgi:hypothetical protein
MSISLHHFIGVALLAAAIVTVHCKLRGLFKAEKARSRTPFCAKLLRPPGESLRLRIDDLQERITEQAFVLAVLLLVPSLLTFAWYPMTVPLTLVFYGLPVVACGFFIRSRWQVLAGLREELRNCRLGFDGERHVAEELTPLSGLGYRIFHDFPLDFKPGGPETRSNIDHIVIGPAGIFAIETKTRRKLLQSGADGQPPHQVFYDGTALTFPGGHVDHDILNQASRQAGDLVGWLNGSAPQSVAVVPVVVIPGWMVERTGKGPVKVLNPKELVRALPKLGRQPLTASEIQQLGDRIEDKCRDLEPAA